MNLFNNLADTTMKRIIKFIIKKLIGKYLKEELIMDQIEYTSKDGFVTIYDIALDHNLINKEIQSQVQTNIPVPYVIKSIHICSITTKLVVSTLLTDPMKCNIHGVSIEIEPNTNRNHYTDASHMNSCGSDASSSMPEALVNSKSESTTTAVSQSSTGVKLPTSNSAEVEPEVDLGFIMDWIDMVLSRMLVCIFDVDVYVLDGREAAASCNNHSRLKRDRTKSKPKHALKLHLDEIQFHVAHPQDIAKYSTTISRGPHGTGSSSMRSSVRMDHSQRQVNKSVTFKLPNVLLNSNSNHQSVEKARSFRASMNESTVDTINMLQDARKLVILKGFCVELLELESQSDQKPATSPQFSSDVDIDGCESVSNYITSVEACGIKSCVVLVPGVKSLNVSLRQNSKPLMNLKNSTKQASMKNSINKINDAALNTSSTDNASTSIDIDVSCQTPIRVYIPLSSLFRLISVLDCYKGGMNNNEARDFDVNSSAMGVNLNLMPTRNTIQWLEKICSSDRQDVGSDERSLHSSADINMKSEPKIDPNSSQSLDALLSDHANLDHLLSMYRKARAELIQAQNQPNGEHSVGVVPGHSEEELDMSTSMAFYSAYPMTQSGSESHMNTSASKASNAVVFGTEIDSDSDSESVQSEVIGAKTNQGGDASPGLGMTQSIDESFFESAANMQSSYVPPASSLGKARANKDTDGNANFQSNASVCNAEVCTHTRIKCHVHLEGIEVALVCEDREEQAYLMKPVVVKNADNHVQGKHSFDNASVLKYNTLYLLVSQVIINISVASFDRGLYSDVTSDMHASLREVGVFDQMKNPEVYVLDSDGDSSPVRLAIKPLITISDAVPPGNLMYPNDSHVGSSIIPSPQVSLEYHNHSITPQGGELLPKQETESETKHRDSSGYSTSKTKQTNANSTSNLSLNSMEANVESSFSVTFQHTLATLSIARLNYWISAFTTANQKIQGVDAHANSSKNPVEHSGGAMDSNVLQPFDEVPCVVEQRFQWQLASLRVLLEADRDAYDLAMKDQYDAYAHLMHQVHGNCFHKSDALGISTTKTAVSRPTEYQWCPMDAMYWQEEHIPPTQRSGSGHRGSVSIKNGAHTMASHLKAFIPHILRVQKSSLTPASTVNTVTESNNADNGSRSIGHQHSYNIGIMYQHDISRCGLLLHGDNCQFTTYSKTHSSLGALGSPCGRSDTDGDVVPVIELSKLNVSMVVSTSEMQSGQSSPMQQTEEEMHLSDAELPDIDVCYYRTQASVLMGYCAVAATSSPGTMISLDRLPGMSGRRSNPNNARFEDQKKTHLGANPLDADPDGETDRPFYSLRFPKISPSDIITITAHGVGLKLSKYQYDLFLIVCGLVSPPPVEKVDSSNPSDNNSKSAESGFGIRFAVEVSTIVVSENTDQNPAETTEAGGTGVKDNDTHPLAYCLSIYSPTIQLYSVQHTMCFGISAADLSIYEYMALHSICSTGPGAVGNNCRNEFPPAEHRGARHGSNKYHIPLIHRTKLNCPWDEDSVDFINNQDSDPMSNSYFKINMNNKPFKTPSRTKQTKAHVFEFQMLMQDEYASSLDSTKASTVTKTMSINLSLQDVTLRYDPVSTWLLRIVDILTPSDSSTNTNTTSSKANVDESVGGNAELLDDLYMNNSTLMVDSLIFNDPTPVEPPHQYESQPLSGSAILDNEVMSYRNSPVRAGSFAIPRLSPIIYRRTNISVQVSRFMVDYCSPKTPSRVLLSVGLLSLASHMNSTSAHIIPLKFTVHDVSLYLANRCNDTSDVTHQNYAENIAKEQDGLLSPSGVYGRADGLGTSKTSLKKYPKIYDINEFLERHAFVQMCTLDYVELLVKLNDSCATPTADMLQSTYPKGPASGLNLCPHVEGNSGVHQPALSISAIIGVMCMYACVDSLSVFANTMNHWWEDFKPPETVEVPIELVPEDVSSFPPRGPIVEDKSNSKDGNRTSPSSVPHGRKATVPLTTAAVLPLYPAATRHSNAHEDTNARYLKSNTLIPPQVSPPPPQWMKNIQQDAFRPSLPSTATANTMCVSAYNMMSEEGEHLTGETNSAPSGALSNPASGGGINTAMIDDFFPLPDPVPSQGSSSDGMAGHGGGEGEMPRASTKILQNPNLINSIYGRFYMKDEHKRANNLQKIDENEAEEEDPDFQQARWLPLYGDEDDEDAEAGTGPRMDADGNYVRGVEPDEDDGFEVYIEEDEEDIQEDGSPVRNSHLMSASIPNLIPLKKSIIGGTASMNNSRVMYSDASDHSNTNPDSAAGSGVIGDAVEIDTESESETEQERANERQHILDFEKQKESEMDLSQSLIVHSRAPVRMNGSRRNGSSLLGDSYMNNSSTSIYHSILHHSALDLDTPEDNAQNPGIGANLGSNSQRGLNSRYNIYGDYHNSHYYDREKDRKDEVESVSDGSELSYNPNYDADEAEGLYDDQDRMPSNGFGFHSSYATKTTSDSLAYLSTALLSMSMSQWNKAGMDADHEMEELKSLHSNGGESLVDSSNILGGSIVDTESESGSISGSESDSDPVPVSNNDGKKLTPEVSEVSALMGGSACVSEPAAMGSMCASAYDFRQAWETAEIPASVDKHGKPQEQQAKWYSQAQNLKFISHHIPLITAEQHSSLEYSVKQYMQAQEIQYQRVLQQEQMRYEQERTRNTDHGVNNTTFNSHSVLNRLSREFMLPPSVVVKVHMSMRLRMFGGCDWKNSVKSDARRDIRDTGDDHACGEKSCGTDINTKVESKAAVPKDINVCASVDDTNMDAGANSYLHTRAKPELFHNVNRNRRKTTLVQPKAHSTNQDSGKADTHTNYDKQKEARTQENMLELSVKDAQVYIRIYPKTISGESRNGESRAGIGDGVEAGTPAAASTPCERIMCNAQDILISYGAPGQPVRKVLGAYKSSIKPREINTPFITLNMIGYCVAGPDGGNESGGTDATDRFRVEYRLYVALIPLRVYLDKHFINFVQSTHALFQLLLGGDARETAVEASEDRKEPPLEMQPIVQALPQNQVQAQAQSTLYFQVVEIKPIELKLDYISTSIDFMALQQGDYLQLLDLFPFDGLSITLGAILITGASNDNNQLLGSIGSIWLESIMKNQLHRIVTGTAVMKGVHNIGQSLGELLLVPLKEFTRKKTRESKGRDGYVDTSKMNAVEKHNHMLRLKQQKELNNVNNQSSNASESGLDAHMLLRNIHKGTSSLVNTVASEALHYSHKLTMLVAHGITDLAAGASARMGGEVKAKSQNRSRDVHGNISANRQTYPRYSKAMSHSQYKQKMTEHMTMNQPKGIADGLGLAYDSIQHGIYGAMDSVLVLPMETYAETSNAEDTIHAVVKGLPIAILKPLGGVTEAVSYTLLGLRNQINPHMKNDEEDIYRV